MAALLIPEADNSVSWRIEWRIALCTDYTPCPAPYQEDLVSGLDFGELNITSVDDDILDEAAGHIQENLEDELVQEALRKVGPLVGNGSMSGLFGVGHGGSAYVMSHVPFEHYCIHIHTVAVVHCDHASHSLLLPPSKGLDLRQYSRQLETELRKVEVRSIQDCIPNHVFSHLNHMT